MSAPHSYECKACQSRGSVCEASVMGNMDPDGNRKAGFRTKQGITAIAPFDVRRPGAPAARRAHLAYAPETDRCGAPGLSRGRLDGKWTSQRNRTRTTRRRTNRRKAVRYFGKHRKDERKMPRPSKGA